MIAIDKLIMEAMKARNKVASETYKLLKAKILEFKTAKNAKVYNESEEINLIRKMIDDRNNSAEIYKNNNRADLADEELRQAEILNKLLPKLPTLDDVRRYLNEHYPDGIDKKDIGKVIKEVKSTLIGVDGKTVSEEVMNIIK